MPSTDRIADFDVRNFMTAWDNGLVTRTTGCGYKAARSASVERFFNASSKKLTPRTFTLASEVVITIGTLARLHFEFGWPEQQLGMQSVDYAFDLVAYPAGAQRERIACEVKKSDAEVAMLLEKMRKFCAAHFRSEDESEIKTADTNAFRKVRGLRRRNANIFWAVGPNGTSEIYSVAYHSDGSLTLTRTDETALRAPV